MAAGANVTVGLPTESFAECARVLTAKTDAQVERSQQARIMAVIGLVLAVAVLGVATYYLVDLFKNNSFTHIKQEHFPELMAISVGAGVALIAAALLGYAIYYLSFEKIKGLQDQIDVIKKAPVPLSTLVQTLVAQGAAPLAAKEVAAKDAISILNAIVTEMEKEPKDAVQGQPAVVALTEIEKDRCRGVIQALIPHVLNLKQNNKPLLAAGSPADVQKALDKLTPSQHVDIFLGLESEKRYSFIHVLPASSRNKMLLHLKNKNLEGFFCACTLFEPQAARDFILFRAQSLKQLPPEESAYQPCIRDIMTNWLKATKVPGANITFKEALELVPFDIWKSYYGMPGRSAEDKKEFLNSMPDKYRNELIISLDEVDLWEAITLLSDNNIMSLLQAERSQFATYDEDRKERFKEIIARAFAKAERFDEQAFRLLSSEEWIDHYERTYTVEERELFRRGLAPLCKIDILFASEDLEDRLSADILELDSEVLHQNAIDMIDFASRNGRDSSRAKFIISHYISMVDFRRKDIGEIITNALELFDVNETIELSQDFDDEKKIEFLGKIEPQFQKDIVIGWFLENGVLSWERMIKMQDPVLKAIVYNFLFEEHADEIPALFDQHPSNGIDSLKTSYVKNLICDKAGIDSGKAQWILNHKKSIDLKELCTKHILSTLYDLNDDPYVELLIAEIISSSTSLGGHPAEEIARTYCREKDGGLLHMEDQKWKRIKGLMTTQGNTLVTIKYDQWKNG